MVTPHDIDLLEAVEKVINIKLEKSTTIDEENDIIPILNEVAKAKKEAQLTLMENGFDDKLEVFKNRKKKQNRKLLRKSKPNE